MRKKFLDYDARRKPKTSFICAACMKDMDPTKPHRAVAMVDGEPFVVHPDDAPSVSDLWVYPIGEDCAKKLGFEWTTHVVPVL